MASTPRTPRIQLVPDMPICQQDLPLDWYQEEFRPYAEEYLALLAFALASLGVIAGLHRLAQRTASTPRLRRA